MNQQTTDPRPVYAPDNILAQEYDISGVFARIIDSLPDDSLRHGYKLNIADPEAEKHIKDRLTALQANAKITQAQKLSRLFGGAIIVIFADDGKTISEPLSPEDIHKIVDLRVYDRTEATPDYATAWEVDERQPWKTGEPKQYNVNLKHGATLNVHASRCIVFKNGELVSQTAYSEYEHWGLPEYMRIARPLKNYTELHDMIVPLMKRSAVGVFKTNLKNVLTAEEGESRVKKRVGILNRIANRFSFTAIDHTGEELTYANATFSGLQEMLRSAMADLSASSRHPQTKIFGSSPGGLQATGESDREFWDAEVESYQENTTRRPLEEIVELLIYEGIFAGKLTERPEYEIEFNPLEVLSEAEEAQLELQKMQTAKTKAEIADKMLELGIYDGEEIRKDAQENGGYGIEITDDDEPTATEPTGGILDRLPMVKKLLEGTRYGS